MDTTKVRAMSPQERIDLTAELMRDAAQDARRAVEKRNRARMIMANFPATEGHFPTSDRRDVVAVTENELDTVIALDDLEGEISV